MKDNESRRLFPAGTEIFREGEPGSCAFVIERGAVEISTLRGLEKIVLAKRVAGEIFGEMAIVDDQPRSATVTAIEDCEVVELTRERLQHRLTNLDPVLRMVLGVVLDRFRETLSRVKSRDGMAELEPFFPEISGNAVTKICEHQAAIERIKLELALKQAIDEKMLALYFQPIVSLATGHVIAFEALARWQHPQKGMIPPSAFLDVADEAGLTLAMGDWAIGEACQAVSAFQQRRGNGADWQQRLSVSVNIAAQQLRHKSFVPDLVNAVTEHGVAASSLTLEITESALIDDPDHVLQVLQECRAHGFTIAVDDFGTGYSSLNYLHRFPLQIMKIDRSFVQAMSTDNSSFEIVRAMVGLAQNLGMQIVAEGIETESQLSTLRAMGCALGQGFLFARPQEFERCLTELVQDRPLMPATQVPQAASS